MRVRTRLAAALAIPVVAASTLAGLRVNDAVNRADAYGDFHAVAQLSRSATVLIQDLQQERDLAVNPLAQAGAEGDALALQEQQTQRAITAFRAQAKRTPRSERLQRHFTAIDQALATLPTVREAARDHARLVQVVSGYTDIVMPLLGVDNELGGELNQSHSQGWALYTLSLSTAMVSSQRALIANAANDQVLAGDVRASLLASMRIRDVTAQEFRLAMDSTELARYDALMAQPQVRQADEALGLLVAAPGPEVLPASWYQDLTAKLDGLTQLETTVSNRLVEESAARQHEARDEAAADAAVAAGLLGGSALIGFGVSRSLMGRLRRLRGAAVDVAEQRLPELRTALDAGTLKAPCLDDRSLLIPGRDEIAEVSQAFDQVYREAVHLAAGQAQLRENVSAVFRNLSHRNQSLVQRQLVLISALEQDEPDAQQLTRLFQLDHLATRMRRNSENLLVLAGGELGAPATGPVPLLDVVRTAMSEVDQYERIVPHTLPALDIASGAVNDVVHLLAELLENAVAFSSPQTEVTVSGQHLPDERVLVEIRDLGIGMTPEQLTAANAGLEAGPAPDADLSEPMGLYVVGTLAHRHGIQVTLSQGVPGGVCAQVVLPPALAGTPDEPAAGRQCAPARRPVPAGRHRVEAAAALVAGSAGTARGQSAAVEAAAPLPQRIPDTSLAPALAGQSPTPEAGGRPQIARRGAEEVRARLSGFQQGARRAAQDDRLESEGV